MLFGLLYALDIKSVKLGKDTLRVCCWLWPAG